MLGWRALKWGLPAIVLLAAAGDALAQQLSQATGTREITFKLTFANRDLVWLGDPGSPTAQVSIKPGAKPIATDVFMTSSHESPQSPARSYMREARVDKSDGAFTVYAFTDIGERVVGTLDGKDHAKAFVPNESFAELRKLLPTWPGDVSRVKYDEMSNMLYQEVEMPGPVLVEWREYLPFTLLDNRSRNLAGQHAIRYDAEAARGAMAPSVFLDFDRAGKKITIAQAVVPGAIRREDVCLGSYDNRQGTYLSEAAYRPGGDAAADASVTFSIDGAFTDAILAKEQMLMLKELDDAPDPPATATRIKIDGNFDDWRNVQGVSDPRGDLVPYLEYVPDVDLLQMKLAHDNEHIYFYARVAGQVGRTHPEGGRSYFYAYMDVDRNPQTGFLPTRDDNCYYGVTIGDDCEVQFEFVDNTFRKTFYGFCGLGGDKNVLEKIVTIGKSVYGRLDEQGREREHYKSEYIFRNGVTEITEDLKLGTSDTIQIAVSPDGSEVEVVSSLAGFLKNREGKPTIAIGQKIDVAIGMECDSRAYPGKKRWAADSTPAMSYTLTPVK